MKHTIQPERDRNMKNACLFRCFNSFSSLVFSLFCGCCCCFFFYIVCHSLFAVCQSDIRLYYDVWSTVHKIYVYMKLRFCSFFTLRCLILLQESATDGIVSIVDTTVYSVQNTLRIPPMCMKTNHTHV